MRKVPTQLKWSEFVHILKALKLKQLPNKRGSARHFQRLSDGEVFTFHEPHGNNTLRQGTLSAYFLHLGVTLETAALHLPESESANEEEQYRHSFDSDGTIISNCMKCLNVVHKSKIEAEVVAAEAAHAC